MHTPPPLSVTVLHGAAVALGGIGAVMLLGPALTDLSWHGLPLHHAFFGAMLIGLGAIAFALAALRRPGALFNPLPPDQASSLQMQRVSEARRIIDEAARSAATGQETPRPQA